MRQLAFALAATAALLVAQPVGAAILISENFESGFGVFTPIGQVGINTGQDYANCCGTTGTPASLANHFASFGSGGAPSGTLMFTAPTLQDQLYTLTFDYAAFGAGSDQISLYLNGTQIGGILPVAVNDSANGFLPYLINFIAPGPVTIRFFSDGAPNADGVIDNVLLTGPVAGGVPEPSTWAMMLLGFGAIGASMRYRRRKASLRGSAMGTAEAQA